MVGLSSNRATPASAAAGVALLMATSTSTPASASKDSDYWPPGESNPLVDLKMYWKDSVNVLQDLSQFKALYVKYHNCAWSKYGSRYGKGYDYEDADDENENGCAAGYGYGGENYWYLGKTQCFRANAAFTLYGVLNDDEDPGLGSDGTYCHKGTYINSFFSTYGVESFGGPLGMDVESVNSYCTTNEPDNEEYMYDYDNADDDFTPYNYKAWTSYGIGCLDGRFVQDKYQGAFCHGSNFITTMDTLDSYNEAMEANECSQIYSYGQQMEDDDDDDEDDNGIDFSEKDPIAILKYSKACSVRQYPHACPDPYGLKQKYAKSWNRYLNRSGAGAPGASMTGAEKAVWSIGSLALVAGAALLFFARRTKQRTALKPKTVSPSSSPSRSPSKKKRTMFGLASPKTPETPPMTPEKDLGDPLEGLDSPSSGAVPMGNRVHSEPLKKSKGLGTRISSSVRNAKLAFQKYAEEEVDGDPAPAYRADAYAKTNDLGVPRNLELSDFGRDRSGATVDSAPSVLTRDDPSVAASKADEKQDESQPTIDGIPAIDHKPSTDEEAAAPATGALMQESTAAKDGDADEEDSATALADSMIAGTRDSIEKSLSRSSDALDESAEDDNNNVDEAGAAAAAEANVDSTKDDSKEAADAVLSEMGAASSPPVQSTDTAPSESFKKKKKKRPLLNKLSKSLFGPSKKSQLM